VQEAARFRRDVDQASDNGRLTNQAMAGAGDSLQDRPARHHATKRRRSDVHDGRRTTRPTTRTASRFKRPARSKHL
jgi:hypothetical protein